MTDLVDRTSKLGPPSGFGVGVNNYLNHYVNVADAKAAGTLTADLTLGGYLMAHVPVEHWVLIFHWAAFVFLIISGSMALYTLYPRTPKVGSSLIFWEDVHSRATLDIYVDELRHMDEAEVERQYGAQNHIVSGVLSKKYASVRWGMRALMVAIPLIILNLLVG